MSRKKKKKKHENGLSIDVDVEEDGSVWWQFYVKWDGCIEIYRAFNIPFDMQEGYDENNACNMHICDLSDFIKLLEEVRDVARDELGEHAEWNGL